MNVAGLHSRSTDSNSTPVDFFRVRKGATQTFRMEKGGIRRVFIKGDSGNATVDWGVTGRTSF